MNLTAFKRYISRILIAAQKVSPEIWILIVALLAYHQIAFLQYSLKWDMIVGYLPRRYFIGESLQNGIFPFWNPYGQCGYPIYANLISTWSPEILLPAFISGYTNLTLHLFFMIHIAVAGLGMFYLMMKLISNRSVALMVGIAYMLSGFFIGHAQHMNIVTGAAWLPLILLFYIRLQERFSLFHFLALLLFLFFMISGSYPALTIILAYIMGVLFLYYFVQLLYAKSYKRALLWGASNAAVLAGVMLLSLGQFLAFREVTPYISRFENMPLTEIMSLPFSPRALLSLLFPFGTAGNGDFWQTDISMANGYFGLLMLLFVLSGFLAVRSKQAWLFLGLGAVSLAAALGDVLPVREWLCRALPFMDKFRYPAVFRIFFILFFLIFSGYALDAWHKGKMSDKKAGASGIFLLGLMVLLLVFGISNLSLADFRLDILKASPIGRMVIHGIFQIVFLLLFLLIVLQIRNYRMHLLGLLIVVEMVFAVQLNMHSTGVSQRNPVQFYNKIQEQPAGFPIPSRHSLDKNTNASLRLGPAWQNGSIFRKEVSFDTYNPFLFRNYKKLDDSLPELRDALLQNELVYFSDSLAPVNAIDNPGKHPAITGLPDSIYKKLAGIDIELHKQDSLWFTSFKPNRIAVKTRTENDVFINLLQSNYPGWQVRIDGKPVEHYTANHLFISSFLPAGTHKVVFSFRKPRFLVYLAITYGTFALILAGLLILLLRRQQKWSRMITLAAAGLFILTLVDGFSQQPYEKTQKRNYRKIGEKLDDWNYQYELEALPVLASIDHPPAFEAVNPFPAHQLYNKRFYFQDNIPDLIKKIRSYKSGYIIYVHSNVYVRPEVESLLKHYYPQKVDELRMPHAYMEIRKKGLYDIDHTIRRMEGFESFRKPKYQTDTTYTFEGARSLMLQPDQHYSPAMELSISESFKNRNMRVYGMVRFRMPDDERAFLVLKYFNDKNMLEEQYAPLSKFRIREDGWNEVILAKKHIPGNTNRVRAFVWKPGKKAPLWIDELELVAY